MDERVRTIVKSLVPDRIFRALLPAYHFCLALVAALVYRFPARKLVVVGVTGTKGKTTTSELISAVLESAGRTTALSTSLRFKLGAESEKNELKMTMPGRFFLQRFLRRAVRAGCGYAVIEMTSEGTRQHRHRFLNLNAVVFTNLAPEHIESHGSYEAYRAAKLEIFKALERSRAKRKFIVINKDDAAASFFLETRVDKKVTYGLGDVTSYTLKRDGILFTIDDTTIDTRLTGLFNLYNMLGAIAFARAEGIGLESVKTALESFRGVPGRMEHIEEGQDFTVVVDYAHTPDSLEKVYDFFQLSRKICVLGSCGGGRDKWKRPKLGEIAAQYCDNIIITNEDPYDEDPRSIMDAVASPIPEDKLTMIEDRGEAIREAISRARTGDAVIITGKGAEPWLMGPKGTKLAWDDRAVARDALKNRV